MKTPRLPRLPYRVGKRVKRTVYCGDIPLFVAINEDAAADLVTTLNAGAFALQPGAKAWTERRRQAYQMENCRLHEENEALRAQQKEQQP